MKLQEVTDWYGQKSDWQPRMGLWVTDGILEYRFTAKKTPLCELLPKGTFVEGLWEKDVAELFVAEPSGCYQEINLSPTGAWWSATFSGYRERENEVRPSVEIETRIGDGEWTVGLRMSISELSVGAEADVLLYSPTAILYGPEPFYFAPHHEGEGEPDFHRAELFKPLGSSGDH